MKKIFIITRYSVLNKGRSGFRLAKYSDNFFSYKNNLFSDNRLLSRHKTFTKITASCLMNMHHGDANIHFLVLVSDLMPAEHMEPLMDTLQDIDSKGVSTKILAITTADYSVVKDNVYKTISEAIDAYIQDSLASHDEVTFVSVRLDDDDALSSSFCMQLENYMKKDLAGFPVTFPYGLQGYYDTSSDDFKDVRKIYYPKIALGLSFINHYSKEKGFSDSRIHVYRLGNHTKIDQSDPVIFDSMKLAYFRTISLYNDSGDIPYHNYLPKFSMSNRYLKEYPFLRSYHFKDKFVFSIYLDKEKKEIPSESSIERAVYARKISELKINNCDSIFSALDKKIIDINKNHIGKIIKVIKCFFNK